MINKKLIRLKEAKEIISKEDIEYFYITLNLNRRETAKKLNVCIQNLDKLIKLHEIKKTKEDIDRCRNNTKIKMAGSLRNYYNVQSEHYKQTMLEKYGVEASMQVKEFFDKGKQTKLERYGDPYYCDFDKLNQTNLNKYGKKWFTQTKKFQEKASETWQEKYGVPHHTQNKLILEKCWESRKKNGTLNSSKLEEYCYQRLLTKFDSLDIVRQYIETRYPFHCDFYIKSLDVFIEVNGTWLHGFHLFDENNPKDVERLSQIRNKQRIINGRKNQYYKAEQVWIYEDPKKLVTAKLNSLKYFMVYSIEEIDNLIDTLKELMENL